MLDYRLVLGYHLRESLKSAWSLALGLGKLSISGIQLTDAVLQTANHLPTTGA